MIKHELVTNINTHVGNISNAPSFIFNFFVKMVLSCEGEDRRIGSVQYYIIWHTSRLLFDMIKCWHCPLIITLFIFALFKMQSAILKTIYFIYF